MDVFEPGPGPQLHDLNPTAPPPIGLFWTVEVPPEAVDGDLNRGSATLQATNIPILDFGEIPNALGGMRPPVPGNVSFRVVWTGTGARTPARRADQFGRYTGEFVRANAQMEWTARVADLEFRSAPIDTSSSSFAILGQERNGIFFS